MKLSQQGLFLRDNQNKGSQPYVLNIPDVKVSHKTIKNYQDI